MIEADALAQQSEAIDQNEVLIVDPINPLRRKKIHSPQRCELLRDVVAEGRIVYQFPSLEAVRARRRDQLLHLHESYRRLRNAHEYKVGLTYALWRQKEQMLSKFGMAPDGG